MARVEAGHGDRHAGLVVLRNGRIHTFDPGRPLARSLAIDRGRIIAFDEAAEALAPAAVRRFDLDGACVIPGFNDTHAHLEREGLKLLRPSLAAARSIADVLDVIRQQAAVTPPGDYIVTMPVGTPPFFFNGPTNWPRDVCRPGTNWMPSPPTIRSTSPRPSTTGGARRAPPR